MPVPFETQKLKTWRQTFLASVAFALEVFSTGRFFSTRGFVEGFAQFVEVKAHAVDRTTLGEHVSVAIQYFSADSRHAHGSRRLRLLVGLIFSCGNDLHPPQPSYENAKPAK